MARFEGDENQSLFSFFIRAQRGGRTGILEGPIIRWACRGTVGMYILVRSMVLNSNPVQAFECRTLRLGTSFRRAGFGVRAGISDRAPWPRFHIDMIDGTVVEF